MCPNAIRTGASNDPTALPATLNTLPSAIMPTSADEIDPSHSPSSSSSSPSPTPTLSPQTQTVLSHLTRSKLQRAAAGRMSGGRGAPSLRQLVLWTNALVAPGGISSPSSEGQTSGWYDDADDEGAQDGYGSHGGDDERKQAEQEWFENLMEEMVDLDDDEEEDTGESSVPPPVSLAIVSSPPSILADSTTVSEDERYVNIRFRHRGWEATEADSGFLETPQDSSPLADSFVANEPAALQMLDSLARPPSDLFAQNDSPPPQVSMVSALTAQLRRPEEVPLPVSPSASPERRVIVRDLDPAGELGGVEAQAASWSSLLECEEVTVGSFSPLPPPLSPTTEEQADEASSMMIQPASCSSAEMPALTPDRSPPGLGFLGPASIEDEAGEEGCGWHRMLQLRRGLRHPGLLSEVIEGPSSLEPAEKAGQVGGFGSWLLGAAPFASEDSLVSPPGLDTMELGNFDELAFSDRLKVMAAKTSTKGRFGDFTTGGEPPRLLAKKQLFGPGTGIVRLAETPPSMTSFHVPPAPPLPPVLPSVLAPHRPWSSARAASSSASTAIASTSQTEHTGAALPVPHSLGLDGAKSRATSPRRWSGIVRTWFDCVDLGLCSSTGLAPFGTLEAAGAQATEHDGADHDQCSSPECRKAQQALSIVISRPGSWRPTQDRDASPSRLRAIEALDLLG